MNFKDRLAIREMYKTIDTSMYDPYPIDWTKVFTPIEYMAWCDIRDYPLQMWPQYPIGKYFADFANVEKKIVIECDGKEWHDEEKDSVRDAAMMAEGWTVYRVTGAECNKVVEREDYKSEKEYWHNLYQTSSGLIKAIHYFHFPKMYAMDEYERDLAAQCLRNHAATGFYFKQETKKPAQRGFK